MMKTFKQLVEELTMMEESELDELNMSTLQSYTKKALDDKNYNKRKNRPSNVTKALLKVSDKLNKFDQDKKVEEEAELNEISKATLARYAKAAPDSAETNSAFASYLRNPDTDHLAIDKLSRAKELEHKARNRRQGHEKAIDRLAKEEAEISEKTITTLSRFPDSEQYKSTLQVVKDHGEHTNEDGDHHIYTVKRPTGNHSVIVTDKDHTHIQHQVFGKNIDADKASEIANHYKKHGLDTTGKSHSWYHGGYKIIKEGNSLRVADLMDGYLKAINNQDDFSNVLRQEAELNEISKATLARYAKAAPDSAEKLDQMAKTLSDIGHDAQKDNDYERSKQFHSKAGELMYKAYGRRRGHEKAIDKLTKD